MNDFKVGDVVRHKATGNFGPNMSVTVIKEKSILCTYWHVDEKTFKRAEFYPQELEAATPNRGV